MEESTQTPIDKEAEAWEPFGRMMRQEDKILFERMLTEAKMHAKAFEDSGKEQTDTLLMALILEQQKMIRKLMNVIEKSKANKSRASRASTW